MTGHSFTLNGGVRFAPSPTGRFHIGNLRTAWIAEQFARKNSLPLVVRFEDIDKPRVLAGAQEQQLDDMKALGLKIDRVYVQSANHTRHFKFFLNAVQSGQVYACDCSRKEVQAELAGLASAPHSPHAVYSGHCRKRGLSEIPHAKSETLAWRFKMPDISGQEDFVIARTPLAQSTTLSEADFTPAYHWACAIDDFDGRYQLLVRAWDLESSARLQRAIQTWLGANDFSAIFHTALVVQNDGHRLEKRTKGVTLPELNSNGLSSPDLIKLFEKSFAPGQFKTLPPLNSLLGETNKSLALEKLGL